MADYSVFRVALGDQDYPGKYDALITELERLANEVEVARGIETNLDTRLDILQEVSLGLKSHFMSNY